MQEQNNGLLFFKIFAKSFALALGIATMMLMVTGVIFAGYAWHTFGQLTQNAGLGRTAVVEQVRQGLKAELPHNAILNILILGLDSLETRPGSPPLTDSIIVLSANFTSGKIALLSLPRDIWSDKYQTKINALYFYGQEKNPEHPEEFVTEVLSEMTDIPIDHTIVVTMDNVKDLISILGGVEIEVKTAFVDDKFPRDDVDVTVERDPEKLYKTVAFEAGPQTMTGQQAVEYVRSRHSQDDAGTDLARGSRQQEVFGAILTQISSKQFIASKNNLSALFKYYVDNFMDSIGIAELTTIGKTFFQAKSTTSFDLNIQQFSPSVYPENPQGVITNPPLRNNKPYNGQWVYIIRDLKLFQQEISIEHRL
jgi:anionic cell wall polymer biosynthesis LytR-Cps2A-Psr (LCP) family protein